MLDAERMEVALQVWLEIMQWDMESDVAKKRTSDSLIHKAIKFSCKCFFFFFFFFQAKLHCYIAMQFGLKKRKKRNFSKKSLRHVMTCMTRTALKSSQTFLCHTLIFAEE